MDLNTALVPRSTGYFVVPWSLAQADFLMLLISQYRCLPLSSGVFSISPIYFTCCIYSPTSCVLVSPANIELLISR